MKGKVIADVLLSGAAATAAAYWSYRKARDEADRVWRDIEARATAAPDGGIFNEATLNGLPEIAQRYFRHAIAPGTRLRSAVRIEMSGTFLLGENDS